MYVGVICTDIRSWFHKPSHVIITFSLIETHTIMIIDDTRTFTFIPSSYVCCRMYIILFYTELFSPKKYCKVQLKITA